MSTPQNSAYRPGVETVVFSKIDTYRSKGDKTLYIDIVHAQNHIPDHYNDYLQGYRAVRLLEKDETILGELVWRKDFYPDGDAVMYSKILKI